MSGVSIPFRRLCDEASGCGLHVELWTDHRAKSARGPEEPTPRIDELRMTDAKRTVVYRVPTGLRNLDQAANRALAELPR